MPSGVRRREDLPPGAAVTLGGRVAIVTGAASGIGRAIAGALARAGARVAVADLNEAGGLEAARQIEKDGGAAAAWRVGITDAGAGAAMGEREVARHRINVNCVCPGPSETPLFQTEFVAKSPKLAESLKRVIPWGRLGTPEDVAPAVVFLASDEAGFITGQTLSVSGGLTMI